MLHTLKVPHSLKVLHDLNDREIPLCLFFNRANQFPSISLFFTAFSRLGNGVFWYALIVMLPIVHGMEAMSVVLHMTIAGLFGLVVYKWLKVSTKRIRPYNFHDSIFTNAPVLDQFSFPSGHVQHAICFTLVLLHYYPEWASLVVPFTALVALSRVILGLHYPSDVVIGAAIGFAVSHGSIYMVQHVV